MTILHVTPCLAPAWAYGRVAQDVDALARAQAAAGHDVIVLTTDALAPHERLPAGETLVAGVRVIRVRNVTGALRTWLDLSSPFGFTTRARALFAQYPIDIVHLHELTTVENVSALRAVPPRVPVLVSSHGKADVTDNRGFVRRAWDRHAVRTVCVRASGAIEHSAASLAGVQRAWRSAGCGEPGHVAVIPRGSAVVAATSLDHARHAGPPVVLFAGRLTAGGSLESLLRAVAATRRTHPSLRLVVAGGDHGGRGACESLAHTLGLVDAITWLGHVPMERLSQHVADVDVVALPREAEPYGDLALMSLAAGASVLAAVDAASLREADRDALTPVVDSPEGWQDVLATHLEAHGAGNQLRLAARATAARYSWEAVSAEVVAAYRHATRLVERRA